jgi:GntR family transcriptional regulator/MocR family aminotransferase
MRLRPAPKGHLGTAGSALLVRVDAHSGVGLQRQIYGSIRRSILDGVVAPGTRLPASRALADDLDVSRTTTLLAYEQLLAEGYVTARRGSGTFVAQELPDDLPRLGLPRRTAATRHPPLSRRGLALAATPAPARRLPGPPRAFRIGVPALDLFPMRLWSQLAGRRLRAATLAQLDYGDPAGWPPLRDAIAHYIEAARGTRCAPEQVIIVAGAQRGVELVCQLLLDPGDAAWLEEPGYSGARSALVGAGARIVPVRVDKQGLDVEAGVRLAPNARLVTVTPSHQFPLGVPMSLSRRLALLRWAGAARAWIVEDDYDSEFRYGTRPVPCLHGLDADGRVIYVGTFSKSLFPALRLGFLIVPPDLRDRFAEARTASDLHPPVLDQVVLADFIAGGHFERHLHRMRAAYRERLDALSSAIQRLCGGALSLRPVGTGLHAVADLEDVGADSVAREASARGVELMPLSAYCMARRQSANALVLGFAAVRADAIAVGVEKLAAAIAAARRPPRRARSESRFQAHG